VQRGELGWEVLAYVANDLEEPVFRRWPDLARLHRELLAADAVAARLSGSGSAMWAAWEGEPGPDLPRPPAAEARLVPVRTLPRTALPAYRAAGG
jgi:hypothetical protein